MPGSRLCRYLFLPSRTRSPPARLRRHNQRDSRKITDRPVAVIRDFTHYGAREPLIDTAPVYGFSRSEEIVGKALEGSLRQKVTIATKVGLAWKDGTVYRDFPSGPHPTGDRGFAAPAAATRAEQIPEVAGGSWDF